MIDLEKLSKKELEELALRVNKRKEEIKQKELEEKRREAERFVESLKEHKDFILSLVDHSRTSCSDENPRNGWGSAEYGARCTKCHLIEILNGEWDGEFEIDFTVNIT